MQEIMTFIEKKKQEFTEQPLFKFMQDQSIDPQQRLGFAPVLAHFVMSFRDLNQYVFRDHLSEHPLMKMVNQHTYEDEKHWQWFLQDLEQLGLNSTYQYTEALKLIWHEDFKFTRQLTYFLARYTLNTDPIVKIAAIEAVEATGNVFGIISAKVISELQTTTNKEYPYFGSAHVPAESGHMMGTPDVEKHLAEIQITDSQRQEAFEVVETIFKLFSKATSEFLAYAQLQLKRQYQTHYQDLVDV